MRRFFMVMISVFVIAILSTHSAAFEFKAAGEYFIAGYRESNHAIKDNAPVQAYYAQRLRIEPSFLFADGLSFTARFDALERVLGQNPIGSEAAGSGRNLAGEQNIQMRRSFITMRVPAGVFDVGYMQGGVFGNHFLDTTTDVPRVKYTGSFGPWSAILFIEKVSEKDIGQYADADYDKYGFAPVYKWSGGEAGALYIFFHDRGMRPASNYKRSYHSLNPYFRMISGPIYLEGEFCVQRGKARSYDADMFGADVDKRGLSANLLIKATADRYFFGGQFAWVRGDDPTTPGTDESGPAAGENFQPTLVLWNDWINRWAGDTGTYATTASQMTNALLWQVFVGANLSFKARLEAIFSYVKTDQKPNSYISNEYGYEFDLKFTYKLYDNLEYMVGLGYLWAGDYFKGTSYSNQVSDDYLLMHQLTLRF